MLIGLEYLGALTAWRRFLDGFAINVCPDRWCSDALFRRSAIPIAGVALVATVVAWWLSAPDPRLVPWLASSVGGLSATFVVFVASPATRSSHLILAGIAASAAASSIWRASRGDWIGTALVGLMAPWPFLAFAVGYPAPR